MRRSFAALQCIQLRQHYLYESLTGSDLRSLLSTVTTTLSVAHSGLQPCSATHAQPWA